MKSGSNINKPILVVIHKHLKRFNDSLFKSYCPLCDKGILFVQRNQETFKLLRLDRCHSCGQAFKYRGKLPG